MSKTILPKNAIEISNLFFNYIDNNIETIIDMTLGNGHDAKKLLEKFQRAFLYGFDIQESALNSTYSLLNEYKLDGRYKLILDSHENISDYNLKADLIIYNLGYLPGKDKKIKTKAESTVKSLSSSIKNTLKPGGHIVIISYTGHDGGMEEYISIKNFLNELDQKKYRVIEINYTNQINFPPILFLLERIEEW